MQSQNSERRVLGLVPARGGSKGIPRKNLKSLAGQPLLAYTARAAKQSKLLSRVLLSTDDSEIAELGRSLGLDVPYLRPPELALDGTPMIDVVLHATRWVQAQGDHYAAICLLQPTSPLRSAETIDRCVSLLWGKNVDTVISVRPVPAEYNPHWVYFETGDGLLELSMGDNAPIPSRQQLPPAYHRDGSIFAAKTETVLAQESLYGKRVLGFVSPEEEAIDLDTEEQWSALERRLNQVAGSTAREPSPQ
jgi:CMP-N,N'-diacetyllegionaminic acid synthase